MDSPLDTISEQVFAVGAFLCFSSPAVWLIGQINVDLKMACSSVIQGMIMPETRRSSWVYPQGVSESNSGPQLLVTREVCVKRSRHAKVQVCNIGVSGSQE